MIDAPLVRVEPFAAQMAMPVSLLPYLPLLGIAFNLPASFFRLYPSFPTNELRS